MFECLNVSLKPAVPLQKLLGAAAAWAGLAGVQEDSPPLPEPRFYLAGL